MIVEGMVGIDTKTIKEGNKRKLKRSISKRTMRSFATTVAKYSFATTMVCLN